MTETHVVVVEYDTENEARAGAHRYMSALGTTYTVERRFTDETTHEAIGRLAALEQSFGAFVYESSGHETLKDKKRGYTTKYFYAVYAPGPARSIP